MSASGAGAGSTPMRWGIIGCGDVTEVKSGPAFLRVPGCELVAVMRRTATLAKDYAHRHSVPRWSCDAEDLLRAPDIDAIYIATHPNTHAEYACRAAAAGKAVYVEKPMAADVTECRTMISACESAGVPLWVAYYRRALPRFQRVRDLIEEGAIGDIRAVNSIRCQAPRSAAWQNCAGLSGGGWFFDAACHTLDWLDYLFGPLRDVRGVAVGQGRLEDTVVASYRLDGDVIGSGTWCFDAGTDVDRTTIIGTEGTIALSISAPDPIDLIRGADREQLAIPDPPHVHEPLVRTIVDEWNGVGRCPSTAASALRTSIVLERLIADLHGRGSGQSDANSTAGVLDQLGTHVSSQ
jgi:predicted dehydrogenase